MKQKLLTYFVTLASATSLLLLSSQPVYALDCTVLPNDICSKAEDSEAIFALLNFFLTILVVLVGIVAIGMLSGQVYCMLAVMLIAIVLPKLKR